MLRHCVASAVSLALFTPFTLASAVILFLFFSVHEGWFVSIAVALLVPLHTIASGALIGWCGYRLGARWQMSIPASIFGGVISALFMTAFGADGWLSYLGFYVADRWLAYLDFLSLVTAPVMIPVLGCGFHGLVWLAKRLIIKAGRGTTHSRGADRRVVDERMLMHFVAGAFSLLAIMLPLIGLATMLGSSQGFWYSLLVLVALHALASGALIGWCGYRLGARWQMSIPAGIVGAILGTSAVFVWIEDVEPALFQCFGINCPTYSWGIYLMVVTIPLMGCGFHGFAWLVRRLISKARRNTAM